MAKKLKEFRVVQSEKKMVEYECFIEAKDLDEAHDKVDEGSECDWNEIGSQFIETNDTEIEEVASEFTDDDGNPISEDEQARADGEADRLRKGEDD